MALRIHRPEGQAAPEPAKDAQAASQQPAEVKTPAEAAKPAEATPKGVVAAAFEHLQAEQAKADEAKDEGGSPQQSGASASSQEVGVPETGSEEGPGKEGFQAIQVQAEASGEKVETILEALNRYAKAKQGVECGELYLVHRENKETYAVKWFDPDTGYASLIGPYNAQIRPRITEREVPKYEPIWRE
ncbi:hypothetical protein WK13_34430 [Burkholderia ubonensis]|uniref:hypothetical protein n=1 Tax=Burkholderia ubonensis TaxID=101571 RepID=UPI00075858F1|nr:hypothetical protein [Burkholderia ubonensis]KVR21637.1 hypothetical protein WK13_34430 [Burkholderia ubonensis]